MEGGEKSRKDVTVGLPQLPQSDAGNTPQATPHPKSRPEAEDADGRS